MAKLQPKNRLAIAADLFDVVDDPALRDREPLRDALLTAIKVVCVDPSGEKGGAIQAKIDEVAGGMEDAGLTLHARFLSTIALRA